MNKRLQKYSRSCQLGVLAGAMLLTGCLSRAPLEKRVFSLTPSVKSLSEQQVSTNVLAIRAVTVSAPYDGKSLVYRTGAQSFETDPSAEFMVAPARLLASTIRESLRSSGVAKVAEPGSALRPTCVAEVHVSELYGDFSTASPAAVLSLRLTLLDSPQGPASCRELIYKRRVPLKERTASALVAAWNTALEDIISQAAKELALAPR